VCSKPAAYGRKTDTVIPWDRIKVLLARGPAHVDELKQFLARRTGSEGLGNALLGLTLAKVVLRDCERGERVRAYGNVRVRAEGRVIIGDRSFFLRGMIPTEVIAMPGAEIRIGGRTGFNYGVSLEAHQRIEIGKRCVIGTMVRMCDCGPSSVRPIVVEDDAWIAHGAILEPGARVGRGSVVSAGSVVTGEIPPDSLAIGNPARTIMRLDIVRADSSPTPAK
jgi:maltose O-acetyltransferase